MDSSQFLSIDDQLISLEQALKYLQFSGKLTPLIGEILRQYVIEQELQNRENLDISPAITEQAVVDFRLERNLTNPKAFAEWLSSNSIDYATFHNQMVASFKLAKLRDQITEPKLQEYFIERKIFLDRVVLSRIIVASQELAEELASQIEEGVAFEELAIEYSLADDRIVNGMMGVLSRGTLPDKIRAAVDLASPGKLVGPLEIEGSWALFKVGKFLPANVEDPQLIEALKNELFDEWLTEKIQKLTVKLLAI